VTNSSRHSPKSQEFDDIHSRFIHHAVAPTGD
jgi:hypothetical protein